MNDDRRQTTTLPLLRNVEGLRPTSIQVTYIYILFMYFFFIFFKLNIILLDYKRIEVIHDGGLVTLTNVNKLNATESIASISAT